MKKILLITTLLFFSISNAQTPCDSGMAGVYPCDGYTLQSSIALNTFGANSGNDSWGWTDPQDGKEYAIMGLNDGTVFIDISDPINPIYLGKLPTHTASSQWRDVKVYNNYAFIVSEASNHGMQIFDLTRLRNVSNPPQTFAEDAHYDGFGNAHNVAINEDTGYAYGVGTFTFSGGAHFVDISDPLNPIAAGGYSGDGYSHDAQVVVYNGPDTDYTGREIYVGSNENEVVIVDVTDKGNPQGISKINYTDIGYTHQGWFTDDQRYFIAGDELDEVFFGFTTRLLIFDFTDLDNPELHFSHSGPITASDHNLYVKGDELYLASYRGGMRVYDISDIANQNIVETSFFDTYPPNDLAGASVGDPGAWNVYPFFDSGNIVITNYSDDGGLFVVRDETLSVEDVNLIDVSILPNPASDKITVSVANEVLTRIVISDITGKRVFLAENIQVGTKQIDISNFSKGMYLIGINNQITQKFIKR